MNAIKFRTSVSDGAFAFDKSFEWKPRDGRLVPAVRRGSVRLPETDHYLFDDASALFLNSSPCLDGTFSDDFDILCEGDSWACLSIYPGHVTMIQHLSRMGYALCNVAKYGRTMQDVQNRKHDVTGYVTKLSGVNKPKAFIISAGANDFIGPIVLSWLKQRSSGDTDPANARKYSDNSQFNPIMDIVKWSYLRLLADVKVLSPATMVLLHSYTYGAGPTHVEGTFLGRYFTQKGFDPIDPAHTPLIKAIIKLLIDRFHKMLQDLKNNSSLKIEIVDFRSMLQQSDIRDEIHPRPSMAPAMAARYVPFLDRAGVQPRTEDAQANARPRRVSTTKKRVAKTRKRAAGTKRQITQGRSSKKRATTA